MKQGLTRAECEAEALFLLLSGTESTACAIRQILVYAITNPPVYSKLKEEVASACRDGNISYPIRISEAKKLPYLQVCHTYSLMAHLVPLISSIYTLSTGSDL